MLPGFTYMAYATDFYHRHVILEILDIFKYFDQIMEKLEYYLKPLFTYVCKI